MKFSALALISTLQLVASEGPQCNPAVHCPSISVECVGCNVRTDANCDVNDPLSVGQGLCVEPAPLDYEQNVYGMKYEERCRRVVDPSWASAKPKPKAEDFVHSCREGHYTCDDGTCELAAGFPEACYNGIFDIPNTDKYECNIATNPEINAALTDFYAALNHDNYCGGKVRYGPIRCDKIGRFDEDFGESQCNGGSLKPPTCSDSDEVITLFGPQDGCSATCSSNLDLFEHPGCCIEKDTQQCSDFLIYRPAEDVGRCSENELEDGCDTCLGTVDSGFSYCCNQGSEPICVDAEGYDVDGKKTKCTDKSGPFPTLKGDVCYVDSSGSTAIPPPVSDTGFAAGGVELTFQFVQPSEYTKENDCCCDLVCSCFGDPHCTSFFGDYEVSQAEKGDYLMIEEDGFSISGELSKPLGVTSTYTIQMGDDTIVVDGENCVYGEGITINGDLVSDTESLTGIDYKRTTDRPNESDKKPYHKNKKLNKHLAINPSFVMLTYGKFTAEVKCLRFEMSRGENKGWWNRLDITVRREVDEVYGEPGCCPPTDDVYNVLKGGNTRKGFCFRHSIDEGIYLPEGQDLTNSGLRRLRARNQEVEQMRDLASVREIAEQYAKVARISPEQAAVTIKEVGKASIEREIQEYEENCKYYASDDIFEYTEHAHCEGGLVLEAKKPTSKEWIPIRFFPQHVTYCNDKVLLIYDHLKVGNKQLDNTYELRMTSCTPDPNICGEVASKPCQPFGGIRDLGVTKYAYDSTLSDAFRQLLELALEECSCQQNPVDCIKLCIATGSCPQVGTCT